MAGVVSGGSKLRPEEAKKFFQDQAPPLFQGLDVHPPPPHSQFLNPALVVSVMGRESPIFNYANPVVRKIVLFYFILFHWKDL